MVYARQGFLESIPGYDEDPETQYLRNRLSDQFLYFIKSCAELCKLLRIQGSQAKIIIFKGRKLSLKLAKVIVIKMHFLGLILYWRFSVFWL
jgi:hypothetical protein